MKAQIQTNNNNSKVVLEELKSFFYIILLAVSIRILIFEPFYIPSGSMRKTAIEGDYLFSTKYNYGYSKHSLIISPNLFSGRVLASPPERGDIIIFRPPHQMNERYIKRLIGMPGDKIELKNGILFINDKEIERKLVKSYEENNLNFEEYREKLPNGKSYIIRQINQSDIGPEYRKILTKVNNIGPFFVPDDNYFFLGDNRDQSGDSRFELRYVPFENFISKVQFIFFSFGEKLWLEDALSKEQIFQIGKWVKSFRLDRFFAPIE